MNRFEEEADKLIDAASAFLDLPIEPAYRPGVKTHLVVARSMADLVFAYELEEGAEPAPIYEP